MSDLLGEDKTAVLVGQVARVLSSRITDLPADMTTAVASAAVKALENELFQAAEFIRLRDAMCRTMDDPDSWDGDDTESGILIEYARHLARATHGICTVCEKPISATVQFEVIGQHGPDRQDLLAHTLCA